MDPSGPTAPAPTPVTPGNLPERQQVLHMQTPRPSRRPRLREYQLPFGGLSLASGLVLVVGGITFNIAAEASALTMGRGFWIAVLLGIVLAAVGLVLTIGGAQGLPQPAGDERQQSLIRYRRYMVGLGYALLLYGVVNLTALAGFAHSRVIDQIFPKGASNAAQTSAGGTPDATAAAAPAPLVTVVLLCVSGGMAVLGALFFVTNSLRTKRDAEVTFDERLFWSGLWYRLGEAVLFTLVFFLVMRRTGGPESDHWLPVLALFLGMFVTSGERIVFGLARRVFVAVSHLLPVDAEQIDEAMAPLTPGAPSAPRFVTPESPDGPALTWDKPAGEQPVRGYRVEHRAGSASVWREVATPAAPPLRVVITDPDGQQAEGEVRVRAFNDAGEGPASATLKTVAALKILETTHKP